MYEKPVLVDLEEVVSGFCLICITGGATAAVPVQPVGPHGIG